MELFRQFDSIKRVFFLILLWGIIASQAIFSKEIQPKVSNFIEYIVTPKLLYYKSDTAVDVLLHVNKFGIVDSIDFTKSNDSIFNNEITKNAYNFRFAPLIENLDTLEFDYWVQLKFSPYILRKKLKKLSGIGAVINTNIKDTNTVYSLKLYKKKDLLWRLYLKKYYSGNYRVNKDTLCINIKRDFVLKDVPSGEYYLKIFYEDKEIFNDSIDCKENKGVIKSYNLNIEKSDDADFEIYVYGLDINRDFMAKRVSKTKLISQPGAQQDLLKGVESLPSINRAETILGFVTSGLVVRGNDKSDTKYSIDGVPINKLYHLGGAKTSLPASFTKDINIYPSAPPSHIQGALGSAIELNSVDSFSVDNRFHGETELTLFDASTMVSKSFDKFDFALSARRSWLGDAVSIINKSSDNSHKDRLYFYDGSMLSHYKINENNRLSLFFTLATDSIDIYDGLDSNNITKSHQNLNQKFGFIRYNYKSDKILLQSSLSLDINKSNIYDNSEINSFYFDKYSFINKFSYNSKILSQNVGLQFFYHKAKLFSKSNSLSEKIFTSYFKNSYTNFLLYYNPKIFVTKNLILSFSYKLDYYGKIDSSGYLISPLLPNKNGYGLVSKPLFGTTSLSSIYKRGNWEYYCSIGNYSSENSNLTLDINRPSFSNQAVAGVNGVVDSRYKINFETFFERGWNKIGANIDSISVDNHMNYFASGLNSSLESRIYGLTSSISLLNIDHFYYDLSLTLMKSERTYKENNSFMPYEYDQPIIVKSNISYEKNSWKLSLASGMFWGNPRYNSLIEFVDPIIGYKQHIIYPTSNITRYSPYFYMNLRFDKEFLVKSSKILTCLEIKNLNALFFSSENESTSSDSENIDEIKQTPMPWFGIKWKF